jgi:hypothetical protein
VRKAADSHLPSSLASDIDIKNFTEAGREADTWVIDSDSIRTYATQLRHNQDLRELLLVHTAMRLNQQRLKIYSTEKNPDVDISILYHHTKKIGALKRKVLVQIERKLKPALEADSLWEDAAIWILARLNASEKHQGKSPDCELEYEIIDLLSTLNETDTFNSAIPLESRTINAYAYHITDHLSKTLHINRLSLEELEKLLGIEKRPIRSSTLLKRKESEKVNNSYSTIVDTQAIPNNQWRNGEYPGWKDFIDNSFINHQIISQHPETARIELIPGKAAWEIMQQFGPEAAYIFMVFVAQATDLEKSWEGSIQVKGSHLLKLYSWDNYQDLTLDKKLKRIGSLVELVCRLSVSICNINTETKRCSVATSALWLLEELEYSGKISSSNQHKNSELSTFQSEDIDELIIRVRPGNWVEKFIGQTGYSERQTLQQYSYLGKSTLQINPYQQRLAARLSVFLTIMSRLHPNGQYEVRDLLKTLESEDVLEEVQKHKDKQEKFVEEWNRALLTLQQLGWEIKFDPETYPEKICPAWSLTEGSPTHTAIRPPNWFYLWLHAKITINPTTLIQHRLEVSKALMLNNNLILNFNNLESITDQSSQRLPRFIPGTALEEALSIKGLSKAKLAEQFGLDRSMVTRWIKGSRPIQSKHRELLWQILGKELHIVLERSL